MFKLMNELAREFFIYPTQEYIFTKNEEDMVFIRLKQKKRTESRSVRVHTKAF